MTHLLNLIEQYGLWMVFGNVFLEQMGLPLPAYPTLVIAGALLANGHYSVTTLLLTAVFASIIKDSIWVFAGRRYGKKLLSLLCRVSLSPDSCVRQTSSIYTRWDAPSLISC